jgi:hypothetical protein
MCALALAVASGKSQEEGTFGVLFVLSDPSGAEVSIDGRIMEKRTPFYFKLASGKHKVTVGKRFYESRSKTVDLIEGKIIRINFKLWKGKGNLVILSGDILGADVYLNERLIDHKTPCSLEGIEAGLYKVRVVKDDMFWEGTVAVDVGKTATVEATLAKDKLPPIARITINDGAEVTVSPEVTITIKANDQTGITKMLVSDLNRVSQWEPFSPVKRWRFSPEPGVKEVRVILMDRAGKLSEEMYARIRLIPPPGMKFVKCDSGFERIVFDESGEPKGLELVPLASFYIDEYEVTNAQYKRFIDETGYQPPPHWKGGMYPIGQDDFPVTNVSYYDARAYAQWAGKRLPKEEEWERAAFGPISPGVKERNEWPWGEQWDGSRANFVTPTGINLRSVLIFPNDASPDGIHNMAGSVWEWVERVNYASKLSLYDVISGRPTPESRLEPALRGGIWIDENGRLRGLTKRLKRDERGRYPDVGFRCVKEIR